MRITAKEQLVLDDDQAYPHDSVKVAANRLGMAPETYRTHLKSLRLKCDIKMLLHENNGYWAEIKDLKNQIAKLKGMK